MKTEGDRPPSVSGCLFFGEVWMLVEAGGRLRARRVAFLRKKLRKNLFWRFAVLAVEIAKSFWGFPLASERKIRPSHTARK